MRVQDALTLPACQAVRPVHSGDLAREVQVAHVVDVAEIQRWVTPGTFLLSTGLSWPKIPGQQRSFGQALADCQPAAVVLATPRYFNAFPAEVARPLIEREIPTFELPYDVPFVQVVQEVHAFILQEQADELHRSERIHRALTRAALSGNLADVALTLSEQLGREVVLLSRDGRPLTPGQAPPPAQVVAALARPGNGVRRVAGGLLTPTVLQSGREGGVWVAGEAQGDLAGRAAEHAATVAGLLLLAQREAEVREARLGYAFVDTLLEGRFGDDPAALERATRLGFEPAETYTLGLLLLSASLPLTAEGFTQRERAAQELREVLISLGVSPLVSVNLNYVWFLIPASLSAARVWGRLGWEGQAAPPGGMAYGRPRVGVEGVAHSRAEVLSLSAYAQPGTLRSYSEVLIPRALSGDPQAQADLLGELLHPLLRSRGGENLLSTVRALCETGFSQVETATRLKVHANTLRYRIERIEAITGRSLNDPTTRNLWWLALQLSDMGTVGRER